MNADPVLHPELPEETHFNQFTSLENYTIGWYATQNMNGKYGRKIWTCSSSPSISVKASRSTSTRQRTQIVGSPGALP